MSDLATRVLKILQERGTRTRTQTLMKLTGATGADVHRAMDELYAQGLIDREGRAVKR